MSYPRLLPQQIELIQSKYLDISLTTYDISKLVNCAQSTVYQYFTKEMKLDRKKLRHELSLSKREQKVEIRKVEINDERLLKMQKKGVPILKMAKILGVNHKRITDRLLHLNIEYCRSIEKEKINNVRTESIILDGVDVAEQIKHYKSSVVSDSAAVEYMKTKF